LDKLDLHGAELRQRLISNRSDLQECVRRVKILDVNRAACHFYGVETKEQLLAGLSNLFDEHAFENFREELVAMVAQPVYRAEFQTRNLRGEERTVSM